VIAATVDLREMGAVAVDGDVESRDRSERVPMIAQSYCVPL